MATTETGSNDIVIHLVNPYKCLDCGTEFFYRNSLFIHLAEHMEKHKAQHPCHQLLCATSLASHQPNSITVTKDIVQINENQMFELQDASVDSTKLQPLKMMQQVGIILLPPREKKLTEECSQLDTGQPFEINVTSQPISQDGIIDMANADQDLESCLMNEIDEALSASKSNADAVRLETRVQHPMMETEGEKGVPVAMSNSTLITSDTGSIEDSSHLSMINPGGVITKGDNAWIQLEHETSSAGMSDSYFEATKILSSIAGTGELEHSGSLMLQNSVPSFKCYKCSKHFADLLSLQEHVLIHKRSHQCSVCLTSFTHKRQLQLHMTKHRRKRFVHFGQKYYEIQVSSSRNSEGKIVQEFVLPSFLSNDVIQQGQDAKEIGRDCQDSIQLGSQDNGEADSRRDSSIGTAGLKQEAELSTSIDETKSVNVMQADKTTTPHHYPENTTSSSKYKVVYQCGHCQTAFNIRATMMRHLMLHTNEKPFVCEQCGKAFSHKTDLSQHNRIHFKPVKCPNCDSAFSRQLYLQNHLRRGCPFSQSDTKNFTLQTDGTYKCVICSKILRSKVNVVRHLRTHDFDHEEPDVKKVSKHLDKGDITLLKSADADSVNNEFAPGVERHIKRLRHSLGYLCTFCGQKFRFKNLILIHVRMHLGRRSYTCKNCSKAFFSKHMLRKHQLSHTRPFKCPKCGKGFNRRYIMKHHFLKGHTKEAESKMKDISIFEDQRMIKCDICGKTMPSYMKSVMQAHIRLHKGIRPHQCKVCQKNFSSHKDLKKHSLNHSKPYCCQVCGKGFSRRYLMFNHFNQKCKYISITQKNTKQDTVVVISSKESREDESVNSTMNMIPFQAEVATEYDAVRGLETFRCVPCDKEFVSKHALTKHMNTFNRQTSCKYCTVSFKDKHQTLAHQRSCLGENIPAEPLSKQEKVLGEKQEKVMKKVKELNSKISSMTAESIDETDKMSKDKEKETSKTRPGDSLESAVSNSDLKDVKTKAALNAGSKYKCPECVRCFSTARGLKIHAASHVRLYRCETCGKEFTQQGVFKRHLHNCQSEERSSSECGDNTDNVHEQTSKSTNQSKLRS